MNKKIILSFTLTLVIPLLYLANIFFAYFYKESYMGPSFLIILGILFSIIGLILWYVSFANLWKSFNVLPKKQKRIKKGLYRYLKHPMYLGIWLTFFGFGLANQSLPAIYFLIFVMTPILIIRSVIEEKKLIKQ